MVICFFVFFFFQAEDGIRYKLVTGVQTCALPICPSARPRSSRSIARWPTVGEAASAWRQDRKSTPSELQSLAYLVCRLLLEKKKKKKDTKHQKKKKKKHKIKNKIQKTK